MSIVRTITTADSEIKVYIDGSDTDRAILLLSGGPGVPDYLAPVADLLRDRFMIARIDQRGTGGSRIRGKDYSIEAYSRDIDAVMDELGIAKFHLFGHSWGGLLAQLYAAGHKDRIKSLFLLSPGSGTGAEWLETEKEVAAYNMKQARAGEVALFMLTFPFAMLGSDAAYRYDYGNVWRWYFRNPKEAPPADAAWLGGIHAAAVNGTRNEIVKLDAARLDAAFADCAFPVMVAFGRYDIYGESKEYTLRRFPKASIQLFENAGHLPWIQDRATFARIMGDYYRDK